MIFNRACAVIWALLLLPALKWWPDSVALVIVASVYANVKSDWGIAAAADDRAILNRLDELERLIRESFADSSREEESSDAGSSSSPGAS